MSEIPKTYTEVVKSKEPCDHSDSDKLRFVDFGPANERLNDKYISVTELWICKNCGVEFERAGVLYSPVEFGQKKLFIAVISWAGYTAGSMLGYLLQFTNLV